MSGVEVLLPLIATSAAVNVVSVATQENGLIDRFLREFKYANCERRTVVAQADPFLFRALTKHFHEIAPKTDHSTSIGIDNYSYWIPAGGTQFKLEDGKLNVYIRNSVQHDIRQQIYQYELWVDKYDCDVMNLFMLNVTKEHLSTEAYEHLRVYFSRRIQENSKPKLLRPCTYRLVPFTNLRLPLS